MKAVKGDNSAFEELMNPYLKIIYNYICMHVSSQEDSKDVLQDTMLAVWQGLLGFDHKSGMKTWIFGIARRKIADYYRRFYRNHRNKTIDILEMSEELHADFEIDRVTDQIAVQDAVGTLNDQDKELVYLIFNAQLTYKQVEQITGINEGTIKSRMYSIRAKLKKQLKEGGYD
ncbi:MAG: hypothetical protein K0S76_2993 [Herbinix sp.]|nr:hypothetical protein [Herbinix sp.]